MWRAISSDCQNAEISLNLSESLSQHAVSVIKCLLRSAEPFDKGVIKDIAYALRTLGNKVKSLAYVELFREQDTLSEGHGHGILMHIHGAEIWANALEAGTPEAYTYLMKQDFLSKLSQDYSSDVVGGFFVAVIPAFISSLAHLPSPLSTLEAESRAYLFQPNHLLTVCTGLGAAFQYPSDFNDKSNRLKQTIRALINLDPEHPLWTERASYFAAHVHPSRLNPEKLRDSYTASAFHLVDWILGSQEVAVLIFYGLNRGLTSGLEQAANYEAHLPAA
ncbi:hypothetical protein HGRIS_007556 [Hohenbuehelia grisea]|uniref:Uncharacterized protein n=1 Tax=Hohenbuehelia grisea TaxID=104357 RepID=A0ABR3J5N6_9AGAR